jgi:hypothetical protein
MSARPGPCGGQSAMVVPTAITANSNTHHGDTESRRKTKEGFSVTLCLRGGSSFASNLFLPQNVFYSFQILFCIHAYSVEWRFGYVDRNPVFQETQLL